MKNDWFFFPLEAWSQYNYSTFFQVISKETTKFIKRLISELKDKFGNKLDDEPENILFDLENLTNNDIKKLDWPH